jgi:hypothetical protein
LPDSGRLTIRNCDFRKLTPPKTGRYSSVFDDEKRLCSAIAGLGAVALQNARLYTRVFQGEETLRKNEQLTTLGLLAAEIRRAGGRIAAVELRRAGLLQCRDS